MLLLFFIYECLHFTRCVCQLKRREERNKKKHISNILLSNLLYLRCVYTHENVYQLGMTIKIGSDHLLCFRFILFYSIATTTATTVTIISTSWHGLVAIWLHKIRWRVCNKTGFIYGIENFIWRNQSLCVLCAIFALIVCVQSLKDPSVSKSKQTFSIGQQQQLQNGRK